MCILLSLQTTAFLTIRQRLIRLIWCRTAQAGPTGNAPELVGNAPELPEDKVSNNQSFCPFPDCADKIHHEYVKGFWNLRSCGCRSFHCHLCCHALETHCLQTARHDSCCMLQDEYMGHVRGLRRLLAKRQQAAVQQMRTTMSGLTADIAKAKDSIKVFQQAASLASTKDGRASMMLEYTAISKQLNSLTTDEHNLEVKLKQAIEKHRGFFCQQLWVDVCDTS